MKFLASTAAAALTLLPLTAAAQQQFQPSPNYTQADAVRQRAGVLPPLEYDKPYPGTLTIIRADEKLIGERCPKTWMQITLGCNYRNTRLNECTIYILNDELLNRQGWSYWVILRHEQAHCLGWGGDHKGARPIWDTFDPPAVVSQRVSA